MPKYEVKAPDGQKFEVNAPEGATEQDAIAYVQKQFYGGNHAIEQKPDIEDPGLIGALTIGAGRTADQLVKGLKQAGLGVIEKTAPTHAAQRARGELDRMAREEAENKAIYDRLREIRPFATGIGEGLAYAAIPVGGMPTAAARIGVPALASGAVGALSYGDIGDRAGHAVWNAGTQTIGGLLGETASRVVRPLGRAASAPKTGIDAAERIGYKLTASERAGSQALRNFEDYLAQAPGSRSVYARLTDSNQKAINRAAARTIGENTDAITSDTLSGARAVITAERDALRATANVSPAHYALLSSIREAEKELANAPKSLASSTPKNVIDELKDFVLNAKEPMTGKQYQTWRTYLKDAADAAFKSGKNAEATVYKDLLKGLDEAARAGKEAAWHANDKAYASLKMLESPGVVNEITGNVSPPRLASALHKTYSTAAKEGKLAGDMADIAAIAKSFPPLREGSQTFGRSALWDIMNSPLSPSTLLAPVNWGLAKAMTSQPSANYIAHGLLPAHPGMQDALLTSGRQAMRIIGPGIPAGLLYMGE